jgi:hypothetical protein
MIESWQGLFPDVPVELQLEPAYRFGGASDGLVLHDGYVAGVGGGERPCRIELTFDDRPWVRWQMGTGEDEFWPQAGDTVELTLRRLGQDWAVRGYRVDVDRGFINNAEFATPDARLQRVIVHWINLPNILASGRIATDVLAVGSCWGGRWQFEVGGWRITADRRHDYADVMADVDSESVFVMTHVMEIRRVDDTTFDVDAIAELLECLRVCLSFGFGRWVAPALPVGYDASGQVVWERWEAPIVDPAKKVGNAWLWQYRPQDIEELVERSLTAFLNPDRRGMTRFQMILAVQAVEAGFVEQRVFAAFPALENLAWGAAVLDGVVSAAVYNSWPGRDRLRFLLEDAKVSLDVDEESLPALAAYAAEKNLADGPAAVVSVRNKLVHPKSPDDLVYSRPGLAADVWMLTRHYLNLAILRSIGYRGSYVRLLPPFGAAGNAQPVPWTLDG